MEILLLRHGKTAGNLKKRYNGRTDEPLCGEGRREAESSGVLPFVKEVYVSPMKRTQETASICFPNARQIALDGLREMDFGVFEGRSPDDMAGDKAYRAWVDGNCEDRCPGGEGIRDLQKRASETFFKAVCEAIRDGKTNLYFSVHGGTIMALMQKYAGESRAFYHWYTKNCGGYTATVDETEWAGNPHFTACRAFEKLSEIRSFSPGSCNADDNTV